MQFQVGTLLDAIGDAQVISVSRKPFSLGVNLQQDGPHCYWTIYQSMLKAAKLAKTLFVAQAEDDVLYTREHFTDFRPPLDAVSYDRSRWSLFAWEQEPIYCLRQRIGNSTLIAPREYLIDALEERAAKWPDGAPNDMVGEVGRKIIEKKLQVPRRKMIEWWCDNPSVQLNHLTGTDVGDYGDLRGDGRHYYKKHGQIKAIEIPVWGKASDVVKYYSQRPTAIVSPQLLAG